MNIVFRADASVDIGSGHVMRSLTLATALKERHCNTHFICRELEGSLISSIKEQGHNVVTLSNPLIPLLASQGHGLSNDGWLGVSWQQDRDETLEALKACGEVDWLVADNYGLDCRWHKAIRERANNILVIDDLADRRYDCDILLDQTFGRDKQDYSPLIPAHCRCFLGTEYALLRPQFGEWRKRALMKRKTYSEKHPRILVSMGGTDPNDLTTVVLSALQKVVWKEHVSIDVILGKHAPHAVSVRNYIKKSMLDIQLHQDVDNMAEIMACSDLAVGTGGTTSWERCCLALPTILVVDAENQELISEKLSMADAVVALHPSGRLAQEIAAAVGDILFDRAHYSMMSSQAAQICDGYGVNRMAEVVCQNV